MQARIVIADVLFARNMQLNYRLIIPPEHPLHEIHFFPCRTPDLNRNRNVLPGLAWQAGFFPFASIRADDPERRSFVRNNKSTVRSEAFVAGHRAGCDSVLLDVLGWRFSHGYMLSNIPPWSRTKQTKFRRFGRASGPQDLFGKTRTTECPVSRVTIAKQSTRFSARLRSWLRNRDGSVRV